MFNDKNLSTILNNIEDSIVIIDANTNQILYSNSRFHNTLGYTFDELLLLKYYDINSYLNIYEIKDKLKEKIEINMKTIYKTNKSKNIDSQINIKKIEINENEYLQIRTIEKITQRKDEHIFIQKILDTIPNELIVINNEGEIILKNKKAEKNFNQHNIRNKKRYSNFIKILSEKQQTNEIIKEISNNCYKYTSVTNTPILNSKNELELMIEMSNDITDLINIQNELEDKANYDNLTKLGNRSLFNIKLEKILYSSKIENTSFSLFFIDLDHFKNINDTLGHDCGDDILIYMSNAIKKILINKGELFRLGGDEFTAIIETSKINDIQMIAKEINNITSDTIHLNKNKIEKISTSIGVSIFDKNNNNDTKEELLKKADEAMYIVKNNGKNNYHIFNENQ